MFASIAFSSVTPVWAQESEPEVTDNDTETVEQVEPAAENGQLRQDRIVVTGSRLQKDEFTSSSPVQVITSETSTLQGLVSASEVLQSASVAAGSGQINNTFTGFVVDGGPGIDTISLRGLGAQRSLVLLNGRRMPPAGVGGTVGPVDLNILPQSIINRIEILKDGASSVYGSDAVAGVVNVITRDAIEGFEIGASTNFSEFGGGEEYSIYGAYGKAFDRGSFTVSAEYYEQDSLTFGDRQNLSCPQDFYFNEDGSRADAVDPRTGEFKCFRSLEGYVQTFYSPTTPFGLAGSFYGSRVPDPNGTNYEGVPGFRFIPFQERSYDDPRDDRETAISPRRRTTVFGTGEYRPEAFDTTELYGEFLYHTRDSEQINNRQLFPWYHPDSPVNPYGVDNPAFDFGPLFGLPAGEVVAPINGFTARPIVLVPFDQEQEVELYRLLGGARGEFTGDFLNGWNWDMFLSHSSSDASNTRDVIPLDRVEAGTGTIDNGILLNPDGVCGPSAPEGCVPLDLFATPALFDGLFPPQAQDYYFQRETQNTTYDQTIFEASMTGDVFELPAGNLPVAVGLTYRQDEIEDIPGEFSIEGNVWGLLSAIETVGDDSVLEVFGEMEVPILANKPLAEELSLNLSARYSDYDSVGSATTYKIGGNWQLNPSIRFRATYGTSFRAPQLYELFLGDQTSFISQVNVDPCINYDNPAEDTVVDPVIQANCAADGLPGDFGGGANSAEVLTGGGLDLEPEDSTATTLGLVLTPEFADISLAIDYFDIEVENQIESFAAGVVGACYADPDFRSEAGFCDLFTRVLDPDAANFGTITNIDGSYRNIPSERTSGIDLTGRYAREFDIGTLTIDAQATWTETFDTQLFPGAPFEEFNGLIGEPEWVGNAQSRFERNDWTFTWTLNYTGDGSNIGYEGEDGRVDPFYAPDSSSIASVDEFITHDISVRKEWDTFTAVVGIANLFNEEPPIISAGDDAGSAVRLGNYPRSSQYYDGYIGRSFFFTLEKEF
jgi:iron complex outermembrane receptor protein